MNFYLKYAMSFLVIFSLINQAAEEPSKKNNPYHQLSAENSVNNEEIWPVIVQMAQMAQIQSQMNMAHKKEKAV